jgi:DNA-binding HxlR family transcriptional regulator
MEYARRAGIGVLVGWGGDPDSTHYAPFGRRHPVGGLVLKSLVDGPKRYSEVSHDLAGVSQKMLTQTLRNLERDGLVIRTVTPSVPVRVDYALTLLGELQGVLGQLKTWAEQHMPDVDRARAGHDAQR